MWSCWCLVVTEQNVKMKPQRRKIKIDWNSHIENQTLSKDANCWNRNKRRSLDIVIGSRFRLHCGWLISSSFITDLTCLTSVGLHSLGCRHRSLHAGWPSRCKTDYTCQNTEDSGILVMQANAYTVGSFSLHFLQETVMYISRCQ